MSRTWDIHDFNDPDEDPVTRLRHLGGDYGPYDPAFEGFGEFDEFDFGESEEDESEYDALSVHSCSPSEIEEFITQLETFHPRNPKDVVRPTPGFPMISLYDTRYFVPQWDEQMLGPAWKQERAKWDFDNPPKPLPLTDPVMQGAFKYCEECQLTWLVGYDGLEGHHHPHHLAVDMDNDESEIHRYGLGMEASIVIFVHGASVPVGKPSKSPVGNFGGIGIFFGEGSMYNQAQPAGEVTAPRDVDTEYAELEAVDIALAIVKLHILEDRKDLLMDSAVDKWNARRAKRLKKEQAKLEAQAASEALTSTGDAHVGETEIEEDDDDDDYYEDIDNQEDVFAKLPFRIIIVSDKIQVVDNVCKHYKAWTEKDGQLFSKKGNPIKNGDRYQNMIFSQLEDDLDVYMKWYHVPKEQNSGAVKLATEALQGKFSGLGYGMPIEMD
ncbi:hypothetical protein ABKA04_005749 [Annulohypoxylon sp. FPYF3050]